MRQANSSSLEEVRRKYQIEIDLIREQMNKEYNSLQFERSDEFKLLRSVMESDRANLNTLMKENESLKIDLR
jgi:hypothetical protein